MHGGDSQDYCLIFIFLGNYEGNGKFRKKGGAQNLGSRIFIDFQNIDLFLKSVMISKKRQTFSSSLIFSEYLFQKLF